MINRIVDIRPQKKHLREKFKTLRRQLDPEKKRALDDKILNKFTNLWLYREATTILIYVSTAIEVDTRRIIEKALHDGKRVAVPRCVDGTRDMEFYYIEGLEALSSGTFGVLEPIGDSFDRVTDLDSGLCVVPALSFDRSGYRLGYGKGYYDRFLSRFSGDVVGLCYSLCLSEQLPHGKFDRIIPQIVTERGIINIT